MTRSHMTLAADCCWVISPRYFYHIYNRWGSQTTERGKQSLPLCEDSHFLPCKENNTKERRRATISRIGTRCAGWLFEPGMDGTEVERAQGRRTEEKAQGMPCAHVNQRRTNYQTVTSEPQPKIFPRRAGYASRFRRECFLLRVNTTDLG